tara:strand:+ start:675 stop:800 length:126 start_codon:yes stop_codon:yes gene_type:complete
MLYLLRLKDIIKVMKLGLNSSQPFGSRKALSTLIIKAGYLF